jgi:hypothetical protein
VIYAVALLVTMVLGMLFAAVLGTAPVPLAAVRAVSVHPQVAAPRTADLLGALVQAGLPEERFPATGGDLSVAGPAAQQHVHTSDGTELMAERLAVQGWEVLG